jgi:hypothetical protein
MQGQSHEQGFVTVVSGLPRSGTSLLMQMLAAGGLEPMVDGQRAPDEDNPRGYFELDAVKRLKTDATWLPEARDRAVKVISHLLFDLPATESYRIVLMQRDLWEVIASQDAMLARAGHRMRARESLADELAVHLMDLDSFIAGQPNMRVLRVEYAAAVHAPLTFSEAVNNFVGGGLDTASMARVVDAGLYRNRRMTRS